MDNNPNMHDPIAQEAMRVNAATREEKKRYRPPKICTPTQSDGKDLIMMTPEQQRKKAEAEEESLRHLRYAQADGMKEHTCQK